MRYFCHKNKRIYLETVLVYGLQQELLGYVKILMNDYTYNKWKLLYISNIR